MIVNVVVSSKELEEMNMSRTQLRESVLITLDKRAVDHHEENFTYSSFDVTVTVEDAEPAPASGPAKSAV